MKWLDRIKTDFLFTRPDYAAKTLEQAIVSVFSFSKNAPDLVSPKFILDGDSYYARGVENLVLAVRGLSAKKFETALQTMRRIPLFNSIILVLREWDVEAVGRELALLQREPRERSFADFGPVLMVLLKPYYRLSHLSLNVHLLPAITKMYELARLHAKTSDERYQLHRYYTVAREELQLTDVALRNRLFPVLLKLLSDTYLEADQFYLDYSEEILALVGVADSELLRDTPGSLEASEGNTSPLGPKEYQAPPPKLAQQGFVLLDQLFPKAGFLVLDEKPDLYSYFQTVLSLPKGSDLISADDPIQVILLVSEILQNLFFGFQNMEWGNLLNQDGEVVRLQEEIDRIVSRWHFFIEEYFVKNYLPLLAEYCREIERSGSLSPDAKRCELQLLWMKRNYLMPHLIIPVMEDVRPKTLGYPNFSFQVKEMMDLLSPVAVEAEQKGKKLTALINPDAKVVFSAENIVSQRFQNVLRAIELNDKEDKRPVDQATNKTLLFYTLSILTALYYNLSQLTSPLYQRKPKFLYRTSEDSSDDKPNYTAPPKASLQLLTKLNELPPPLVTNAFPWMTNLRELYGQFISNEEIKARIHEFHADHVPFCIVAFRVTEERFAQTFPTLLKPLLGAKTEMHPQDDGSWFCILRRTLVEEAEELARKVLDSVGQGNPPLALAALVIPFYATWTFDKMMTIPSLGWRQASSIPPQALGVFSTALQTFQFRTDTVAFREVPQAKESVLRVDAPPGA